MVVENNVSDETYNSKKPVKSGEIKKRIGMTATDAGLTLDDASKYV